MHVSLSGAALVLIALLAALLPVAGVLVNRSHWDHLRRHWRAQFFRRLWTETLGSVSVSYFIRGGTTLINGSATPPTAAQAQQVMMQKAVIHLEDSDVQILFTHNWGLDISAPTYFDPEAWINQFGAPAQAGGTWQPCFTWDFSNTNVVKINKLNFLGTGGTYLATLRRPHSTGQ